MSAKWHRVSIKLHKQLTEGRVTIKGCDKGYELILVTIRFNFLHKAIQFS